MILQEGDSGYWVEVLQKILGVSIDGSFGPETKAAVIGYQMAHGLNPDGIVGPLTEGSLKATYQGVVSPVSPNPPVISPIPVAVNGGGGPIYGVDVYHLDDVQSWSEVLNGGFVFATCKASQGLEADPKFTQYFTGAKAAGLIVGGYHFYDPSEDQTSQANFFANILQNAGLAATDFAPILDFEKQSGADMTDSDYENALVFLASIASSTARKPGIYASEGTMLQIVADSRFDPYWKWPARYRSISQGPGVGDWTEWQYSENATVPGIGNPADADIYNGSIADLQAWISKT